MDDLDLGQGVESGETPDGDWQPGPIDDAPPARDTGVELPDTGDSGGDTGEDTGTECARLVGTGCSGLAGVPMGDCEEVELDELIVEADDARLEGGGCTCAMTAAPSGLWLAVLAFALVRR